MGGRGGALSWGGGQAAAPLPFIRHLSLRFSSPALEGGFRRWWAGCRAPLADVQGAAVYLAMVGRGLQQPFPCVGKRQRFARVALAHMGVVHRVGPPAPAAGEVCSHCLCAYPGPRSPIPRSCSAPCCCSLAAASSTHIWVRAATSSSRGTPLRLPASWCCCALHQLGGTAGTGKLWPGHHASGGVCLADTYSGTHIT